MKITVCMIAINMWYQEIVKYNIENVKQYCLKHNYKFVVDLGVSYPEDVKPYSDIIQNIDENITQTTVYDGSRDCPWYKIKLVEKCLDMFDAQCANQDNDSYVVWIDADSHLLNNNQMLEDYITRYQQGKHMLLAKEGNPGIILNTGVMFVRNTEYSRKILGMVWNNDKSFDKNFHEQASLGQLYIENVENIQENIVVLHPCLQYEFLCYWYMYEPNKSFIIHAARCAHEREGFIYTMDMFCPVRLREESDEEYKNRMEWLYDREKCVKDISVWRSGGSIKRNRSARNKVDFV